MGADDSGLRTRLLKAWQELGWRFAEEGLHPGLSDRAWKGREGMPVDGLRSTHAAESSRAAC
jgi:hypothetical protein